MIKDIIYFAKVRPDAIIPSKNEEDAGYDFYPNFESPQMIIEPFTSRLIPTGVASAFVSDYVLLLAERGSTGVKNMKRNAGVVDSGFRGEIQACIYNGNSKPAIITKEEEPAMLEVLSKHYIVYPYKKAICQGLLLILPKVTVVEKSLEDLIAIPSKRGKGMLGSSGK